MVASRELADVPERASCHLALREESMVEKFFYFFIIVTSRSLHDEPAVRRSELDREASSRSGAGAGIYPRAVALPTDGQRDCAAPRCRHQPDGRERGRNSIAVRAALIGITVPVRAGSPPRGAGRTGAMRPRHVQPRRTHATKCDARPSVRHRPVSRS